MKRTIITILTATYAAIAFAGQLNVGLEAGYDFTHLRSYFIATEQNATKKESTNISHVTYHHSDVIDTYDEVEINGRKQRQNVNTTPTKRLPQMHGFHVGPTFDYRFNQIPSLGLRFGVQFVFLATGGLIFDTRAQRDARVSLYKNFDRSSFITQQYKLQLPLRLSYTFKIKRNSELWIMTGPKFNVGIAAVTDDVTYSASKDIDLKIHTDYYSKSEAKRS